MGHNLTLPFAQKENFSSNITLVFSFDFSNFESCEIGSNHMGRVYYMARATIMEMKNWLIRFLCAHGIKYHAWCKSKFLVTSNTCKLCSLVINVPLKVQNWILNVHTKHPMQNQKSFETFKFHNLTKNSLNLTLNKLPNN